MTVYHSRTRSARRTAFASYLRACKAAGVNFANVKNIASHYLYGTDPKALATLSAAGIVYNPPGH